MVKRDLPVSHDHHFVHLRDLVDEKVSRLKVTLLADFSDVAVKVLVVRLGQMDAWEQVRDDTVEERHVMGQKLGQVDVDDTAQDLCSGNE